METVGYNRGDDCDQARLWGWVRDPGSNHWRLVCYGEDEDAMWQWLAKAHPVLHERLALVNLPRPDTFPVETRGTSIVVLRAHRHPMGGGA